MVDARLPQVPPLVYLFPVPMLNMTCWMEFGGNYDFLAPSAPLLFVVVVLGLI